MKRLMTRRQLLAAAAVTGVMSFSGPCRVAFSGAPNAAPGSIKDVPPIGLGTWLTFNVGSDIPLLDARTSLLREFFHLGGRLIDCAPMYGSSADALGYALDRIERKDTLLAAEKVWRPAGGTAAEQIRRQAERWGIGRINLAQIHNLSYWRRYLPALQELKEQGVIDAIGVTTSHGRRHRDLQDILATQDIDVVQLTYNIHQRAAERDLLPLAAERGVAVIANRPFSGGTLIQRLKRSAPLPAWAAEYGIKTWAEFLLGFIVSHPAVMCAIPATTRIDHLRENMRAAESSSLQPSIRQRMARYVTAL